MKNILSILLLLIFFPAFAQIDENEFSNIEQLFIQGEYEDALRFCSKKHSKFNKDNEAMLIIAHTISSNAAYLWYDFNNSNINFKAALAKWKALGSPWNDKYIVGLYLAKCALIRNQPLKALEILSFKADFDKIPTKYLLKSSLLKAEIFNQIGDFKTALAEIQIGDSLVNHPSFKENNLDADNLQFKFLYQKCTILFNYGDWTMADSVLLQLNEHVKANQNISFDNKISVKLFEADYLFARKRFDLAFTKYLNLYNALETYNDHEYKKIKSLQMAGICASNLRNVTDITKIMRRADMLSISKLGKNHPFVAGLDYLKCYNLYQSGQYNVLMPKIKFYIKKYSFLGKAHPDYFRFFELKAKAEEANGLLKPYYSSLDTLEAYARAKFGEDNIHSKKFKLYKADLNWRYYGNLRGALEIYKLYFVANVSKRLHETAPQKLEFLNSLSTLYEYLDLPDSAMAITRKASLIAFKNLGRNDPETNYYASLNAYNLFNSGRYTEAIEINTQTYADNKEINLEMDGLLAKACYLQSYIFDWVGEFNLMNKQVAKANNLALEKEENKFFQKLEIYQSLVKSYISKNNYFRAEKNALILLDVIKSNVGEESILMVEPIMTIALMKIQKGELREAEKYLDLSEDLTLKYYSTTSEKWSNFNFIQCKYYATITDYKRAKEALLVSIEINEGIYGKNHLKLSRLYAEMANLLIGELKYVEANKMFEKAKSIIESTLGKNSPSYANLLVLQANLQVKMSDFDNATSALIDAQRFWTSKLGLVNVYIGNIELIRGDLYFAKKLYIESEKSYAKAASIYSSIFNKKYSEYLKANVGLAKVAYMTNDFKSSAAFMEPVLEERIKYSVNNFSIMSFSQKTNFWAGFREEFELYNAIVYQLIDRKIDGNKSANLYDFILRTKGLLLTSDANIRRQVFQSGDSTLVANFNEWLNQKEYFAMVAYYPTEQLVAENISLDKILLKIEELEKKIQSRSNINLTASAKEVTWEDIKKNLKPNESAVEMVRLRSFNKNFTDTVIYLGLVIDAKSKDSPKCVILKNGNLMEGKYMKYYRNATITKTDDEISYNVFWQPIKEVIPDGNTIYFSSDGVYSQLNPEMLFDVSLNKYALQMNSFVFLTNTKDIIPEVFENKSNDKQFYLYGNPLYYTRKVAKELLPPLDGAEREIIEINKVLTQYNQKSTKLIGRFVTEDTLRNMQMPYVLHISTHGYFMERKAGNELISNPMLNSGLCLVSSGNILDNKDLGYINKKKGILTASEVMDMNFSKTSLVVLSACETGRGEVQVGEGVFGLQRAFLVAGAKAIILSLFKVDDEATKLLMIKFYTKLLTNGGDYRRAFKEAKEELRQSEFKSPIYWGAFIMVEGKQYAKSIN